MKLFDTIAITTLTGLIYIGGYYTCNNAKKRNEEDLKRLETIVGYPISLEHEGNYGYGTLSTIIRNKDGRDILCKSTSHFRNDKAVSLIKSEINGGDNQPIELKGIYRGDIFEIWSVSANGHTLSKNDLPSR